MSTRFPTVGLFALLVGLSHGCAPLPEPVNIAGLSTFFDEPTRLLLDRFNERTPDQLVTVSLVTHWYNVSVIERRIVDGQLRSVRFTLGNVGDTDVDTDATPFNKKLHYESSDPRIMEAFRSLCRQVETAGEVELEGTGVMFPTTTWHVATEYAAVSSCTPPLALDDFVEGVRYTNEYLNYVREYPEVNPDEASTPFQSWDGWISHFPPHRAVLLHLNIRTFDLLCRARWEDEQRAK